MQANGNRPLASNFNMNGGDKRKDLEREQQRRVGGNAHEKSLVIVIGGHDRHPRRMTLA